MFMHKFGLIISITILVILLLATSMWYDAPVYVQDNPCTIEQLVDDPSRIDAAVKKIGPYYDYTITPDGKLYVNKGDGKWLRLKY